jgi:L-rhamnose mutarotase
MVNRLKPECVSDYAREHENAHLTRWKTQLAALREAGAQNCQVFVQDGLSIVIMVCEDLDECLSALNKNPDNIAWQALMANYFDTDVKFDGTRTVAAKKVFDLEEQLQGHLHSR